MTDGLFIKLDRSCEAVRDMALKETGGKNKEESGQVRKLGGMVAQAGGNSVKSPARPKKTDR